MMMPPRPLGSLVLLLSAALASGCGPGNPPPGGAAAGTSAAPAAAGGGAAAPNAESGAPVQGAAASAEAASPKMIPIRGGRFIMGDPDEVDATPHEVTVGPYYMDLTLVTQAEYQSLMGDNPSRWKSERNPVEQVRWSDAVRFCNRRSERDKLQPCYDLNTWKCDFKAPGYRLPTEAEWEFACRGGTTTAYFFGDQPARLGTYAWFDKNSGGKPHPVGQKQPNPLGLLDITGNVWHWCNDFYKVDYYSESPADNPRGPESGANKVVRGGAWRFGPESCRSGYRYNESPGYADVCFGYDIYGFRCVRNAP